MSTLALPDKLYFKIGEVSRITGVKPYVLRYWETEFSAIRPTKTKSQQRVYQRKDIETILLIKNLLYEERFTIEGARARLKELRGSPEEKEAMMEEVARREEETKQRERGLWLFVKGELEKVHDLLKNG